MSRLLSAACALVFLLAAPALAQSARFLSDAEDVPLPPALAEGAVAASFAGAEGRLLETDAEGEMNAAEARAFYVAAMPALGWAQSPDPEGPLVFLRGRERLQISFTQEGARLHARYRLVSRSASMALD